MKRQAIPASGEKLSARIRAAGLRCTQARLSVFQLLLDATSPLSHAEVADGLASQGFDRATVYRNLIELTEAGLLSRIELGDHVWRFELRREEGGHPGEHPHFVCLDCGEVSCLPSVNVRITPSPGSKSSAINQVTEVLLKGRCENCA